MFNKGYLCQTCGPIPNAQKRTRKGVRVNICSNCGQMVTEWERPLNERVGRCGTCGHASFRLKMNNGALLRVCENCNEVFDTWTEKAVEKGRLKE